MKPDEKTQQMLVLSTQWGLYSANVGVQGVAATPTLFSDFIYRGINTSPQGNPDPLDSVLIYLDDLLSYTPLSTLQIEAYTLLHHQILTHRLKDDIQDPSYTPLTPTEWATACDHYLLNDKIFSRLRFHNFKIKLSKLHMFLPNASTLGVVVSPEGITVDPQRIDKIKNTPFPTTVKQMQSYCGFLSSIGLYSSNHLSHFHGILAELCTEKKPFHITDKHRQAFEFTKQALTSEPFFLNHPNQHSPKLLYVDSSDILLGAVLFDIVFPEPRVVGSHHPFDIPAMIHLTHTQGNQHLLRKGLFPIPCSSTPHTSFFTSVAELIPLLRIHNVPVIPTLIRQAVLALLNHSTIRLPLEHIKSDTTPWDDFLLDWAPQDKGIDPDRILIWATAALLDRPIHILHHHGLTTFQPRSQPTHKPPLCLQMFATDHFRPLYQYKPNSISPHTTNLQVLYDLPYMNKCEAQEMIQNPFRNPQSPLQAKVIGYMSKVIPHNMRQDSIWKKESSALIHGLAKFKPLLEASPSVTCMVDSQIVYYLASSNLTNSNLKSRRLGTLLHLEYPNLLMAPTKGTTNISDKLSRLFSLPRVVHKTLSLKNITLPPSIPAIENRALTLPAATQILEPLGPLHSVRATSIDESLGTTQHRTHLSLGDKLLLDNIQPIATLADRLARDRLITAQQATDLYRNANNKHYSGPWHISAGLLTHTASATTFIPPDMEGLVLAYSHLVCGHTGWNRLLAYVKTHYKFPHMHKKCIEISTTCQVCHMANPGTRPRTPLHSVLASYPNEIITADFLEVETIQGTGQKKILVICDYFSKAIFPYDIKSYSSSSVIAHLRIYLAHTGFVTKTLIVDNASVFNNVELLSFLDIIGIKKVQGNANHSQSRGLVESSIRILQTLLRKLLSISPRYNYEHLLFLAPVLLNRAKHPVTGMTPYEMLLGRDLHSLGLLGHPIHPREYRLFTDSIKKDIMELKTAMHDRISQVAKQIAEHKEKTLLRENKGKHTKSTLAQGAIVFLRDFSIPPNGRARKFRPYYLPSPQLVITATATSVVTMRLADGFVSRHHPDAMTEYKGEKKSAHLHKDLPPSVLRFLGQPMTTKTLLQLAQSDSLPLIYRDVPNLINNDIMTRSRTKQEAQRILQQELTKLAHSTSPPATDSADEAEEEEDASLFTPAPSPTRKKSVRFATN